MNSILLILRAKGVKCLLWSRRTLNKVRTNVYTKRAVINFVPIRASKAAFLSVMVGI